MIGFERDTWTTSEREDYIDICITVQNGPLATTLTASISIMMSNATGETVTYIVDAYLILNSSFR